VGQTQHNNTNLINLSQLVGHDSEAATTRGNYYLYDTNSVAASTVGPTNKDNLKYFTQYHITSDFKAMISLNEYVESYKKLCMLKSSDFPYKSR
jgi:hypothetical protein